MNKGLFDIYKKMSDTEKSALNYKFKDSPVGLRLIDFLELCRNRNFKNSDAVGFVYDADKKETPANILENRYFKLRKKMLDELEGTSGIMDEQLLTEEQIVLYRCKNITSASNKEAAYKELIELEKKCWKKNIFEILPDIIDQLIFLNQSFNRLERNTELYLRLENAIGLQYDINRCIFLSRRIYEINFTKGMKFAKHELAVIKDLAVKNKKFPRFLMCYHHISLYYKLGSHDYIHYQQVVSRHLSSFKKLFSQNPDIPLVSYKLNYIQNQHFHFNQITMFYHFNRCEFNEAYNFMKDAWDLVHSNDSILKPYKTESLYFNLLTSQCMADRLTEANETSSLFIEFLKENNQYDKLSFAYVQKARVISDSFPQTFKMDMDFLIDQVDDYIRKVKKVNNVQASLEQTLTLKMKLLFLKKEYEKANKLMDDTNVKNYLQTSNAYDLVYDLIQIYHKNKPQKNKLLEEILKKTLQRKHKATTPLEFMHFNWVTRHVNFLLR